MKECENFDDNIVNSPTKISYNCNIADINAINVMTY